MAEALVRLIDTTENNSWPAFDEIREEEIHEECQDRKRQRKDTTNAFCDVCFMHNLIALSKNVAFYLCYLCEIYVCDNCFEGHESHKYMKLVSEKSESDRQIESFLDEMRHESESEEKFEREEISIVDRVNVQHAVDQRKCYVTGVCGMNNTSWVVSDNYNKCLKIFSIGSNILQRYIRFGSAPWGVTEAKVKREPTEQDVMSAGDITVTNQAGQDKQCLLAVTLPDEHIIVFIDVIQHPVVITKTIKTEQECHSIDICEDKIFTLCRDMFPDECWFVSVISTDGVTIKNINTDSYPYVSIEYGEFPGIAVGPGRFYITIDRKVLCMNDEGKVLFHKQIEELFLGGVSVDPGTNKVYICAQFQDKVYRLDSSFESFESLFNFESVHLDWPLALCLYRDRLYVGHTTFSDHANFVNVVRVL